MRTGHKNSALMFLIRRLRFSMSIISSERAYNLFDFYISRFNRNEFHIKNFPLLNDLFHEIFFELKMDGFAVLSRQRVQELFGSLPLDSSEYYLDTKPIRSKSKGYLEPIARIEEIEQLSRFLDNQEFMNLLGLYFRLQPTFMHGAVMESLVSGAEWRGS